MKHQGETDTLMSVLTPPVWNMTEFLVMVVEDGEMDTSLVSDTNVQRAQILICANHAWTYSTAQVDLFRKSVKWMPKVNMLLLIRVIITSYVLRAQ